MTYFMRWLYTHYIKPEIENSDLTGYEMPFAVVDTIWMRSQVQSGFPL